mgnify:CR=1 FL=1
MCCQLYTWLTVNFPDLCASVYTRTTYRGVAPAPTPLMCGNMRIMPCVTAQKGCAGKADHQDLHRRCMDISDLASCEQLLCHQLPCCSFDEPSFLWKRYVCQWRSISPQSVPSLDTLASCVSRVLRTNFGIEDTCSHAWNGRRRGSRRTAHENLSVLLRFTERYTLTVSESVSLSL